LPKDPTGPSPTGLKATPPSTAAYHSKICTSKRLAKDSQIAAGMPALTTKRTGLSESPSRAGSL